MGVGNDKKYINKHSENFTLIIFNFRYNSMKKYIKILIIITILLMFISIGWLLRCKTNLCEAFYSSSYEEIDEKIKDINLNNEYKVYTGNSARYSSEGAKYYATYDGSVMMKLEIWLYGEMGKALYMYYYDEGELIHTNSVIWEYNKPMYMDDFEEGNPIREKFYFKDGKMVKWEEYIRDDVSRCSDEYGDQEEFLLEQSKELKESIGESIIPQ